MMYVDPVETDFVAPNDMREFTVVDIRYNVIFICILGETAYSYGNTLLLAE
jgi:hypothetical protein